MGLTERFPCGEFWFVLRDSYLVFSLYPVSRPPSVVETVKGKGEWKSDTHVGGFYDTDQNFDFDLF